MSGSSVIVFSLTGLGLALAAVSTLRPETQQPSVQFITTNDTRAGGAFTIKAQLPNGQLLTEVYDNCRAGIDGRIETTYFEGSAKLTAISSPFSTSTGRLSFDPRPAPIDLTYTKLCLDTKNQDEQITAIRHAIKRALRSGQLQTAAL